jgi:hypothetical protein
MLPTMHDKCLASPLSFRQAPRATVTPVGELDPAQLEWADIGPRGGWSFPSNGRQRYSVPSTE